jgi:hypothetical protein
MQLNAGSPPFRQAQGPERVEGLAGGPFSNGRAARRPASAEAPARHSKRRPYTPNGVGGHERDRGSSKSVRLSPPGCQIRMTGAIG